MQKGRNKNNKPAHTKIQNSLKKELQIIASEITSSEPLQFNERDAKSLDLQLKLKEKIDYLQMRKVWSNALLTFVTGIICFQMLLTIFIGTSSLSFSDPWVARTLFPGIFLEIIGLVLILINFLFPKNTKFNN